MAQVNRQELQQKRLQWLASGSGPSDSNTGNASPAPSSPRDDTDDNGNHILGPIQPPPPPQVLEIRGEALDVLKAIKEGINSGEMLALLTSIKGGIDTLIANQLPPANAVEAAAAGEAPPAGAAAQVMNVIAVAQPSPAPAQPMSGMEALPVHNVNDGQPGPLSPMYNPYNIDADTADDVHLEVQCGVCKGVSDPVLVMAMCYHYPFCASCVRSMESTKQSTPLWKRSADFHSYKLLCPTCCGRVTEHFKLQDREV